MSSPFLTATWANLCLVSYAVDPDLLLPLVPPGLELDKRDDRAFVSLVAFDFLDTRVRAIRWPWHADFPEINLRFYVRGIVGGEPRRGVCFIREFVPRPAIAWIARAVYNEPYSSARMHSSVLDKGDGAVIQHTLVTGGVTNRLSIRVSGPPLLPPADSTEHFFKEHEWGFGVDRSGKRLMYRVHHPVWLTRSATIEELTWDWSRVYGKEWGMLASATPVSVIFAIGSNVSVDPISA